MGLSFPTPVRRSPPALAPPDVKAGPVGPGAGPLMTEWLLPSVLGQSAEHRIRQALKLGHEVDWIRAAERVISSKIIGCEWHIEDPDGETIDDEWKGSPSAIDAYHLLVDPQAEIPIGEVGRRMSRRQWLGLSSRHLGVTGTAAWMLDMRDSDGKGAPHALLYVRPDRLTPECTDKGVLIRWLLDKRPGFPGTPVPLEDIILLQFEPPDHGYFGRGLIESSIAKAINNGLIDRHYSAVLAAGGRISGIISPKEGVIDDDAVYQTLLNDWRNIVEQPEAARRAQVVRAPVDFTQTVMSIADMRIIEFMTQNRDALLALWGVPLTMLNGQNAGSTGLNGGESRKYDEAALWQSAVHDRLEEIGEGFQAILDLFEPAIGWAPKLCWDEPSYDDDSPAFERAYKAQAQPLRNSERRAILGLEPIGDPELDNQIWMPVQLVAMAQAPDEEGEWPERTGKSEIQIVDNAEPVAQVPGQMGTDVPAVAPKPAAPGSPNGRPGTAAPARGAIGTPSGPSRAMGSQGKAHLKASAEAIGPYAPPIKVRGVIQTGAVRLRDNIDRRVTPRLESALEAALRDQRDAVAAAVERHWAAIVKHDGKDETMYYRESKIGKPILTSAAGVAQVVSEHIEEVLAPVVRD